MKTLQDQLTVEIMLRPHYKSTANSSGNLCVPVTLEAKATASNANLPMVHTHPSKTYLSLLCVNPCLIHYVLQGQSEVCDVDWRGQEDRKRRGTVLLGCPLQDFLCLVTICCYIKANYSPLEDTHLFLVMGQRLLEWSFALF